MQQVKAKIREISGLNQAELSEDILCSAQPTVLRGLVSEWPAVKAGKGAAQAASDYLRDFYNGASVTATRGKPAIKGHVSYTDDLSQPNVTRQMMRLDQLLDKCLAHAEDAEPPLYYVASTAPDECLPGLTAANPMSLGDRLLLESIWIGNRSRIPAHYDLPDNLACVMAGKRRFTLFPPDQLENLYVGPLDLTPAGQPISVVDFHNPDFDKYPKYRDALATAQYADLAPGDAIFIPSMWWHQVEALSSLNILMNYWWRQSPTYMGPPADTLLHALMTLRDLPPAQKAAWKDIFDHYVFGNIDENIAYIPETARGSLAPMTDEKARQIRSYLLNRLNR